MGRQTGPSRLAQMLDPKLPVLLVVVPLLALLGTFSLSLGGLVSLYRRRR